ncbi:glycosyltransferase family 4 protein [Haloarcula regularis]|uniref:glycosyltransferase family 4 protein n=1 Tax=Haloarcula regularis TaxID=3033392 RepID=UPI0023E798E5|nr:glycosyltransferase family 4 protein [Halomicroarcula sp. SYNS111]
MSSSCPTIRPGTRISGKLAAGLADEGVDVTLASGYPLSTARTIVDTRPDVVHVHWVAPFVVTESLLGSIVQSIAFLQATVVAKLLGLDIVWTLHNLSDHENAHPGIELAVRRVFARLTDAIIVHCPAAQDQMERRYGLDTDGKTTVIPHGHYDGCYENAMEQSEARDRLDIEEDATVFLYFGQIRPYKQVPELVDTFRGIEDNSLRLLVAGKPTDEAEARRVATASEPDKRIHTDLEFIPDDQLQVYFNAADALVLPYRDILTSGSAILGMTFGRPVVGPTEGCLPELLDQQSELLYDPATESLADALYRTSDLDLATLGAKNRRQILQYQWDEIAAETRRVYETT